MSEFTIHLNCLPPAKKNLYRRRKGRGMYVPDDVRVVLDSLSLQARAQWTKPPLKRACLFVTFYVRKFNFDLDNAYQALQDVLVESGILEDDNAKHVPEFGVKCLKSDEERSEVRLVWNDVTS